MFVHQSMYGIGSVQFVSYGGTPLRPHAPADDDIVGSSRVERDGRRDARVATAACGVVVAGQKALRRVARRGDDDLGVEVGLLFERKGVEVVVWCYD